MTIKTILSCAFLTIASAAFAITDEYAFRMSLAVPRVFNNTESLGYRRYQTQTFYGTATIEYADDALPKLTIVSLTNRTHKVAGIPVTYDVIVEGERINLIGNNKTIKFTKPSISFSIDAQPSYVAAYQPTDDNSLVISLSGTGSSYKSLHGFVTGTLGCGCTDYGHTSPTRVNGPSGASTIVDDVAAVYGRWTMKKISK